MGTISTKRLSAATVLSGQAKAFKRAGADGYVITGSAISSATDITLSIPQPGSNESLTALSSGPLITGISYLNQNNAPSSASAVSLLGGNLRINGINFSGSDQVYLNNIPIGKIFVNNTTIYANIPAGILGNAVISVFTTANIGSQSNARVRYSSIPEWITTAALSVYNNTFANILLVSRADSAVTYSVKSGSGSLPNGLTLYSSGYLSGNVTGYTSTTTFSFIVIATDADGQDSQQGFTLSVLLGEPYFNQTILQLSNNPNTTYITDISTNNYNIVKNGDVKPNRFSPFLPGMYSVYFDQSTDYIDIQSNAAWSFGTGDFTIEFFVNPILSPTTNWTPIMTMGFSGGGQEIRISQNINNTGFGVLFPPNSGITDVSAGYGVMTRGQWYHIALTRSGTNLRLFRNGVLLNTFTGVTFNHTNTTLFRIGGPQAAYAADGYFGGYISNFRISKGEALYTTSFTPPTTGLSVLPSTTFLAFCDNTLVDRGPYNLRITKVNDTRITNVSPFSSNGYVITNNNRSITFSSNSWVRTVNTPANFANNDFTVEFWVRFNTNNIGYQPLISNSGSADAQGWMIIVDTNNTISAYISLLANSWTNTIVTSHVPSTAAWTHIALVKETQNNRASLYINGTLSGTTYLQSGVPVHTPTGNLYLGYYQYFGGGQRYFHGVLSSVRILNGTALYTQNFTPDTANLTAIATTSLLVGQSDTLIDTSSNNYTLEQFGNAQPTVYNRIGETITPISNYTYNADSYGASSYFDGTGDYLLITGQNLSSANWTIECWVYFTSFSAAKPHIFNIGLDVNNRFSLVRDSTSGKWNLNVVNSGTTAHVDATVLPNPVIGVWYHVAVVRLNGISRLYVNGILGATNSASLTSGNSWCIGWQQFSGSAGDHFTGYISNFRVVVGTALYTAQAFIVPTTPLTAVANTQLLTLQNDTGTSSNQYVDLSLNNHILTPSGTPAQSSFSPLAPASWSVYFDGSGDYLTLSDNASLEPGSSDLTWEMWINTTSATQYATLYSRTTASFATGHWTLMINLATSTTGDVGLYVADYSTSGPMLQTTGVNVRDGLWHHIAVVRNISSWVLYVDGVSRATASWAGTIVDIAGGPYIARDQFYTRDYVGYISNLRILKGTALYTANFTPSTSSLTVIANTSLLACHNATLTDESTFVHTITQNGDSRVTPFGPHAPHKVVPLGYSAYFNGTASYLTLPISSVFDFGSGDFTVELYVYKLAAGTQTFLDYTVIGGFGFQIEDTQITAFISLGSSYSYATVVNLNTWTHVAFSRASGSLTLWVNGTAIGTQTVTYPFSCPSVPNIGRNAGANSQFVNAYVSNFRITKGIAIYTSTFTPPAQTLTANANTSLLTFTTTSVTDSSPNNFTITGVGNISVSSFNSLGYSTVTGVAYDPLLHGGSAYFNGSSDFITVPASPAVVIGSTTTPFSIEMWLYPIATNSTFFSEAHTGGADTIAFQMSFSDGTNADSAGNFLTIASYNGSAWITAATSTVPITLRAWTHVVGTFTGSTTKIFMNGRDVTKSSSPTPATTWAQFNDISDNFYIGRRWDTTARVYYTGYISNLRMIVGSALYTAGFIPPTTANMPPHANTAIQVNFTGSALYDVSYKTVLASVGDTKVTKDLAKFGNTSIRFDGTGDYLYNANPYSIADHTLGTADFTIEFWLYTTSPSQAATLIDFRPTTTNGFYVDLYMTSTNIRLYVNSADRISGGTILTSTWHHIVLARSSGVTKLFLDGTQVGTNYTDTNNYLCGALRPIIGINGFDLLSPFNGYIDDLRIIKGYARYTANYSVPVASLGPL